MLSGIARYRDVILDGNRANLIALVEFDPLTGIPSVEVIDVVAYRRLTKFQARHQILVVIRELINRLARIGEVISAVISDEGVDSNPSRPRIQALQAGLISQSSACHDLANIIVAIGSFKVITFHGNRLAVVNLADIKERLMDPLLNPALDPEVDDI